MRANQAEQACPICRRTPLDAVPRCTCGYELGQPAERTLRLLRRRTTRAKLVLAGFVILDAGALFSMYQAALHGFVVFSSFVVVSLVLVVGTIRPIRKLDMARESERLLAPKLLPTARVVE